jgi:PKD repeat protein
MNYRFMNIGHDYIRKVTLRRVGFFPAIYLLFTLSTPLPLYAQTLTASFSATPDSGVGPLSVDFTDESFGGIITSWSWTFGDGGTDTLQNPTHTFTDTGSFSVTLTVTGPSGSDDTTRTEYIRVTEQPPVAEFSGNPTTGTNPLMVTFSDSSTGTINSWKWYFGDGDSSLIQNPTHTYNDTGTYDVSLTVKGPEGSDTETKFDYITVTAPPPVANFSANPDSGDRPLMVDFTDQSTGGRVTSWLWDFGDGDADTVQNPSHEYTTTGLFDVSLQVSGPGGTDDTIMVDRIHVIEPLVANFFAFPLTGLPGDTIQFVDQSTGEPGEPSAWDWDFGDLDSSNEQNPKHVYAEAGTYSVTLMVRGNGGRTDDTTRVDYIVISENPPVADFSGSPRSGVVPLGVQFTDLSSGVIDEWAWTFGDGGTSPLQDPFYTYMSSGVFDVSLTVTGPGGPDTETKLDYITVYDSLRANFVGNPRNGTRPLSVQFTDLSAPAGEIDTWKWYFGDGDSSVIQHPQHTYQDSGRFDVTLIITGPAGADTLTRNNYIRVFEPAPVADFTADPTAGPAPLTVNFTDLSTGSITMWEWDFGDGGISFAQNPSHVYTRADQFTVTLTVTGPGGTDTRIREDYITVTAGDPDTILVYNINDPTTAGVPSNVTVEIRDQFDNRVTQYAGIVRFTSDDPGNDSLPPDYTFVPTIDEGIHTFFDGVTLVTVGEREVRVNELGNPTLYGSQSDITVQPNDPASVVITPGDTVDVTVGASRVFTAEVNDAWNNAIEGQRIDIFLKGIVYGSLSENPADPNPTFGSETSRYGFSDSNGQITVLYTAPNEADRYDVLDAQSQPYVPSNQVDDVVIHSDPGGATKLVILPTSEIITTANTPFDITIEAQDDFGNLDPLDNSNVLLESSSLTMEFSDDGFQSTITQITLSGGTTSNLQARDTTTGNPSITASDLAGILAQDTKTNITINPGPADHYTLTGIPGSIIAGDPQTVSVEVLDEWNNRKTDYTGTVTFTTNDPGSLVSLPEDYQFQPGDAGFHTFSGGVTLVTVGEWYLLARDTVNSSVFGIITGIDVTHAAPDSFDISGIPDSLEAGTATPFTVTVLDPYLNIATGYSERITFSTDDPGNEVVLPPDHDFDPEDQGVHLFDNPGLVLVTAGTRMLEAREVGNPSVRGSRDGINVTHTDVDSLILTGLPGTTVAGTRLTLNVEAVDRYTNRVLDYGETVYFTSNDPQATLPLPYLFLSGDQGYHTFVNGVTFRTAGNQVVTAIDTTSGVIGRSSGTNVTHDVAASLVITPSGTVPVTVETDQVFTATVRDSFSNLVAGEEVTVIISDANDGFLSDDPGNPNNTIGDEDLQRGTTDTSGTITVLYSAPANAGLTDILDAYSTRISASEVTDVTIVSVAGGATKLVILPSGPIQTTAGVAFLLTVEARDNNDNRDMDDSTLVSLSSDSETIEFSTDNFSSTIDSLQLVNGQSQNLQARDVTIGTPSITVEDIDSLGFPLVPDTKTNITIVPSSPVGSIDLTFLGRDTLTADGSSTTSIESGTIRDLYGNNVGEEVQVTVDAQIGSITSTDVNSSLPGIQVETDTLGVITFDYRAGTSAGPDTITASSVTGSASGSIVAILQSPPSLAYTEESLNPNTVSPGTVHAFELVLENSGEAGVTLHDTSSFNFGTGQTQFTSLLDGIFFIGGNGGTDTILFLPDTIPPQMPEGAYTPTLDIYGTDSNDAPFHRVVIVSDDNRLHVSSLILQAVAVFADTVSHGDSVEVQLEVKNSGGTTIDLSDAGIIFSPPEGQYTWDFRNLPLSIPPNGTRLVEGSIQVGSLTPPGEYVIDAFVSGTSQGGAVSDSSANTRDSWVVISAAYATYVEGSIEPMVISGQGTYTFELDLINVGGSDINLNRGQTHLSIGQEGEIANVFIPGEEVMEGDSAQTTLTFESATIPSNAPVGAYPATLYLGGNTQYGGPFQQVIDLPDSLLVQAPPVMSYDSNSISNPVISSEYTYSFRLRVENQGGANLELDPAETFYTIEGVDTLFVSNLNSQGASTIVPGTDTTLTFLPAMVPGTLASGTHPSYIILVGNYNEVSFIDTLAADSIRVERPANLQVSKLSSPVIAAQGETFSVVARVVNLGEANITTTGTLNLQTDSLQVDERTKSFGPALPDTVTWQVTVPSELSAGDYLLTVNINQVPLDENSGQPAKLDNPSGVTFPLSVVERNRLSLDGIDISGVPPQNIFRGQGGVPMFPILLRTLGEGEGEIRLDMIEIAVEERGDTRISRPENVLDRVYLKDSLHGEEILAEATAPENGVYRLTIGEEYRIGPDPDTLLVYVDVSNGAGVNTLQLMIDGEGAIEALDLATDTPPGIVEGNSENSLGHLRSPFTVLNETDFASSFKNYPNPMGSGDGSTTFSYYLPEDATVNIAIYTLTGSLVKTIRFSPGENGGRGSEVNQVRWNGFNGVGRYVNNGVYICFATAAIQGGGVQTTKYKLAVMR